MAFAAGDASNEPPIAMAAAQASVLLCRIGSSFFPDLSSNEAAASGRADSAIGN